MDEVANEMHQKIKNWRIELFKGVTDLLQSIYKDVKEVRVVFSNKVIQSQ